MKAIGELLRAIAAEQGTDGSFPSFSSADPSGSSSGIPYHTTFVTAQIMSAIASCEDELVSPRLLREAGSRFIKSQFQDGSVNYWQRGSDESIAMRLPDDMDDTACALIALLSADPSVRMDGEILGGFTRALVDTEEQPGGPYRTWRIGPTPDTRWLDVDPAVNANIAYALQLLDIRLAGLDRYLDAVVERGTFRSPYYPDALATIFFLSRLQRPEWSVRLHAALELLRGQDGGWGSGLRDALAASSFLRTDGASHVSSALLERLADASTLCPSAFCLDPVRDGVAYFAGSSALDAALRIEALSHATRATLHASSETHVSSPSAQTEATHERIMEMAREAVPPQPELRECCLSLLDRIGGFDESRNVTQAPHRFAEALGLPIPPEFLDRLALVNLYGWAAYTAYDDVMDGDATGELISPANVFLRRLSDELHRILPADAAFQSWWRSILDRVDAANAWEIARLRQADFSIIMDDSFLAERSLGHVIAPVAIMIMAGYPLESPETISIFNAFRFYLAARQMHDDAHDWEADLKRGQKNSASLRLLSRVPSADANSIERLRQVFWTEGILAHSEAILAVCRSGHEAIDACTVLARPESLHAMFDGIERGTQKALDGRERTLSFLTSFRPS